MTRSVLPGHSWLLDVTGKTEHLGVTDAFLVVGESFCGEGISLSFERDPDLPPPVTCHECAWLHRQRVYSSTLGERNR
jgi:hypothetical protein